MAGSTMLAKFAGTCKLCTKDYKKGQPIGRVGDGWGHKACSDAQRNRDEINSGETFRSQRGSDWRRGKGPGSGRSRY